MNLPVRATNRYHSGSLFCVALCFVILAPLYWQVAEHRHAQPPDGYENADLYGYYYPMYNYAFGRIAQGEIPLWNPYALCGVPLHTDPGIGLWQPLNLVFALLPTHQGMAWHAFAALALAGIGTALTLRSMGCGYVAAVFGGVVFAFCGATTGIMSRPPIAGVIAWAPWAFWAATEYSHNSRSGMAIVLGIFTALMVLAGSFGAASVMLVVLTAYFAYNLVVPLSLAPAPLGKRVVHGLIAIGTGAALSAIQWAPTMYYAPLLDDASDTVWRMRGAMSVPAQLLDLLSQVISNNPSPLPKLGYLGILPIIFVLPALLHRDARRPAIFFAVALVAAGYFSVAGEGVEALGLPWHAWAYPAAFSAAALAGLGLDRVLRPHDRYHLAALAFPLVLVIGVGSALFAISTGVVRGYLLVALVAMLAIAIIRRGWVAAAAGILLILLLFIDVSIANANRFLHPWTDATTRYEKYKEELDFATREALGGRIALSAAPLEVSLPANTGVLIKYPAVNGAYIGLTTAQADWWRMLAGSPTLEDAAAGPMLFSRMPRPQLLDYMAARVAVTTPTAPAPRPGGAPGNTWKLRPLQAAGGLWENESAMPRAYWAPALKTVGSVSEAAEILANPDFDRDRFCVVDRFTPGLVKLGGEIVALEADASPVTSFTRADGSCSIEDVSPETIRIMVKAPVAGMVVLADSFTPGWRATVDGDPRAIVRANGIFRAVHVTPGDHDIVLTYRPGPFIAGAIISVGAVLVLFVVGVGAAVYALWQRRPRRPKKPAA